MDFISKIKKERLQVIIDNIDNDGEKLQSERRPKLIIYGVALSDVNVDLPILEYTIFDTNIFFPVGEIVLYRPSYLFDFRNNKMILNTASTRNVLETIASASGTCRFARITNAERTPRPIIQFTIGTFNSSADIRVDNLRVEKGHPIKVVSNYIREP
jgi:hypothetical protein